MQQNPQTNPLATKPIRQLLPKFAIPAIVSFLVSALYNIVDQIFIGQGVGTLGNAATTVAFPLVTISSALALLLGVGSASNFNLRLGEGRPDDAARIAGSGLSVTAISGCTLAAIVIIFLHPLLLLFGATAGDETYALAATYTRITTLGIPLVIFSTASSQLIRADGSPTYSMVCQMSGAILNIILDYLFVMVFHWGIGGAALATVLGQLLSATIAVRYFFHFKSVPLTRDEFRPRKACIKAITSLGTAACFNQLAMTIVQITMNNTLRFYGESSIYGKDIPLACVGVITKVNTLLLGIVIGTAQGCQPIVGFNYGAKNYDRVKRTYFTGATIVTIISIIAFLCFQIFPRQIVSIFGTGTEEYFHFSEQYFRIFLFMTFLNGLQPLTSNFFTSIGKAKMGVFMSMTRQIIFLLPLIVIFPMIWGIDGVMYAGPIADGAAGILAILFIVHEMRNMGHNRAGDNLPMDKGKP